jgi:hypothetical protein
MLLDFYAGYSYNVGKDIRGAFSMVEKILKISGSKRVLANLNSQKN